MKLVLRVLAIVVAALGTAFTAQKATAVTNRPVIIFDTEKGRSSWDQVAVLYAARPQLFEVQPGRMCHTSGANIVWEGKAGDAKHYRAQPRIPESALAEMIEDLMAQPPGAGRPAEREKSP
jgi:hypothetical protein